MRRLMILLAILLFSSSLATSAVSARQEQPTPAEPQPASATPMPGSSVQILSPIPGQALQGSVPVIVDTTIQELQTVELTFGYADDSRETWFWIYQGIQPVTGTMLTLWDTSTITDGDYTLRMVVIFKDGSEKSVLVPNLRVRNYTPLETSTPLPPEPTATLAPVWTPTPTVAPTEELLQILDTPTPNAGNPLEISREHVLLNAGQGALAVAGLFLLGAIYAALRSLGRKE